uniref:Putative secreted protein n=1 Tax=Amblyomma americanum TaxID=6943 RepID=A0A0C9S3T1_AMBAM
MGICSWKSVEMRVALLFAMVPVFFLMHSGVCGQIVTTYELNTTDSDECFWNGSSYPVGDHDKQDPCVSIVCESGAKRLTLVECGETRPPAPCQIVPPRNGPYPLCCTDYIC